MQIADSAPLKQSHPCLSMYLHQIRTGFAEVTSSDAILKSTGIHTLASVASVKIDAFAGQTFTPTMRYPVLDINYPVVFLWGSVAVFLCIAEDP